MEVLVEHLLMILEHVQVVLQRTSVGVALDQFDLGRVRDLILRPDRVEVDVVGAGRTGERVAGERLAVDLEKMVAEGTFREDLFYRLNVLRLELPPLRERGADAVLLARFFLARAADKSGRSLHFSPEAEAAIQSAPWPGNIRQLQNEVQRVVALAEGPLVLPTDLAATA